MPSAQGHNNPPAMNQDCPPVAQTNQDQGDSPVTLTNGDPPVTMTTHDQCGLLEIPTNGQECNPATGTTQGQNNQNSSVSQQ